MMTAKGMSVCYKSPSGSGSEDFYAVPSILFWEAVRFVTVKGSDKKIRFAFEPLDLDHRRSKDNIFNVLDKKFHFLQKQGHPPLFTCVLRRTQGVKAMDVHAFVCHSDQEALGLVQALDTVHSSYSTGEIHESGVFGYLPFGADSVRSHGRLLSPAAANNDLYGRCLPSPAAVPSPRPAPAPRGSPPPTSRPRPGPPARLSGSQPNLAQVGLSVAATQQQRGFQLTQADVSGSQDPETYQYVDRITRTLDRNIPPAPVAADHVQNIYRQAAQGRAGDGPGGSLDRSNPGIPGREPQSPNLGHGYSLLSGSHGPLPGYDPYRRRQPDSPPPGQRYSEDRSGSPPLYQRTIPRDRPDPGYSQEPRGTGYSGVEHRPSPPQQQNEIYHRGRNPGPGPVSPRVTSPTSPGFPHVTSPLSPVQGPPGSVEHYAAQLAHNRNRGSPFPKERDPPPGSGSQRGSTGSDRDRGFPGSSDRRPFSDNPNRPVALVTPQKVQGIRVLPPGSDMSQPALSPTSLKQKAPDGSQRDSKSQSKGNSSSKSEMFYYNPEENTQLYSKINKGGSSSSSWKQTRENRGNETAYNSGSVGREHTSERAMDESLLLDQKKDAEIASAMENLSLDYDNSTLFPHAPHGTNFERSLGYFP